MNKILLALSLSCCFFVSAAFAAENVEDELYDGAEIRPMEKTLSTEEKQQENSSDLDYLDNSTQRPELLCSNERLLQQVKDFIFKFEQKTPTNSVQERRARILLVKNLNPFIEVSEPDIKENFEASAAVINLKINEKREIYRICASKDNESKKYKDTYIIIYPYINYYKIAVTNLAALPENLNDATFIFNW